jgi:hypothetical protein
LELKYWLRTRLNLIRKFNTNSTQQSIIGIRNQFYQQIQALRMSNRSVSQKLKTKEMIKIHSMEMFWSKFVCSFIDDIFHILWVLHLIGLMLKYFTQHNQKFTFLTSTTISPFWSISGFCVILWHGDILILWACDIISSSSKCQQKAVKMRNSIQNVISVKWREKSTVLRCFWQKYRLLINQQCFHCVITGKDVRKFVTLKHQFWGCE